MSRTLLLMRHAKSFWGTAGVIDHDRSLNEIGQRDAPAMGHWLGSQAFAPTCVISSPATRAKQTVGFVCAAIGIAEETIHWEPRIYEASLQDLLDILANHTGDANTVLLVGHNPGLEMLVAHLCEPIQLPADGKIMPTAAIAHITVPGAWTSLTAGSAELVEIKRPAALTAER